MGKNTGQTSEDTFVENMTKDFGKETFIYKLTDTKQIKGAMGTGFAKAGPADFVVTTSHEIMGMFYAEVKSISTDSKTLPFSRFTKSQRAAMKRQVAAKGMYNIYVHHIKTDTWYVFNAEEYLNNLKNNVKSFKLTKDDQLWNKNGQM